MQVRRRCSSRLLIVAILFAALLLCDVAAQCTPLPSEAGAHEITLLSDPDGPGTSFTTPHTGCIWSLNSTCGATPGVRGEYDVQVEVYGVQSLQVFLIIDAAGTTVFSTGLVGSPYEAGVVVNWYPPLTVAVQSLAGNKVYDGVRIELRCMLNVANVSTRHVQLSNASEAAAVPHVLRARDFDGFPGGNTSGLPRSLTVTVDYSFTCPRPSQMLVMSWNRNTAAANISSAEARMWFKTGPAGQWWSWGKSESEQFANETMVVRFRGRFDRGTEVPMLFRCTDNRYFECDSHGDTTAPVEMVLGGGSSTHARIRRTPHGGGTQSTGRLPLSCLAAVRCANEATHTPVIDHLRYHSAAVVQLELVGPDGIQRGAFVPPDTVKFGAMGWASTNAPLRYVVFPPKGGGLSNFGAAGDIRGSRFGPNGALTMYIGQTKTPYRALYMDAALDMIVRCRPRSPIDRRPGYDAVEARARATHSIPADQPVPPDIYASTQSPIGPQPPLHFSSLSEADEAAYRGDYYTWTPLDVHVTAAPLSCGLFSNMIARIGNLSGWDADEPGGLVVRYVGRTDSIRIVGGGRIGRHDNPIYYIGAKAHLIGSPAELQMTTPRPGIGATEARTNPNVNVNKRFVVFWECTHAGRNGPRWPHTSAEHYNAIYRDKNVSAVTWTVPSYQLNYLAGPTKEEMGRIDAVSSDHDGYLDGVETFFNVSIRIECPKRLRPCYIVIRDIIAALHPTHNLTIFNGDGSLLFDVLGTSPAYANTQGSAWPIGRYAWDGAIVNLTGTSATPAVAGFTISFYPRTLESDVAPRTPSLSLTESQHRGSPTASRSIVAPPTPTRPRTGTGSFTATRSAQGTLTRPATPTLSIPLTISVSKSATRHRIPVKPDAVSAATATAVASTVATATTVTAASGAAAPPDSVLEVQSLIAVSRIRCGSPAPESEDPDAPHQPDEAQKSLNRVKAIASPAESSFLPFTVAPALAEGYLLGSAVIAVLVLGAHVVWLWVQKTKHESLRIGLTIARFPAASLQVLLLLHYGVAVESCEIMFPDATAADAGLPPLRARLVAGVFFTLSLMPVLGGVLFFVALRRRFGIHYRLLDRGVIAEMKVRRSEQRALLKDAKADLKTAQQERVLFLGPKRARIPPALAERDHRQRESRRRRKEAAAAAAEAVARQRQLDEDGRRALRHVEERREKAAAEAAASEAEASRPQLNPLLLTQLSKTGGGEEKLCWEVDEWEAGLSLATRLTRDTNPITNVISYRDGAGEEAGSATGGGVSPRRHRGQDYFAALSSSPDDDDDADGGGGDGRGGAAAARRRRQHSGSPRLGLHAATDADDDAALSTSSGGYEPPEGAPRLGIPDDAALSTSAHAQHDARVLAAEAEVLRIKRNRRFPKRYVPLPGPLLPNGYWLPRRHRNSLGLFYSGLRNDRWPFFWYMLPFVRVYVTVICIHATAVPCLVRVVLVTILPALNALATAAVRPYRNPLRSLFAFLSQASSASILIVAAVPGIDIDTRISVLGALMAAAGAIGILSTVLALVLSRLESKFRKAYERVSPPAYKLDQARRRKIQDRAAADARKIDRARAEGGDHAAMLVEAMIARDRSLAANEAKLGSGGGGSADAPRTGQNNSSSSGAGGRGDGGQDDGGLHQPLLVLPEAYDPAAQKGMVLPNGRIRPW